MSDINYSPLALLTGANLPEGVVTAPVGTIYQRLTATAASMWLKSSQAAPNVPDAVGWTQLAVPIVPDAMTLAGSGLVANPLRVLGISAAGVVGGGIWAKPEISHPLDDEFDAGTSLNPAWSLTSGALSATPIDPYAAFATGGMRMNYNDRRPNWLMLQPDSSGTESTLTKDISSLPTDYAVWMHGFFNHRLTAAVNNDFTFGLTLGLSTWDDNNRVTIFLNESDVGVIQLEFLKKIAGVVTSVGVTANISPTDHTPFEGVLIQKIGTTFHGWAITNNGSCVHMGSTTAALTIARGGFFASNASSSAPGCAIVGVDFIRFVNGTTYLP